jgi:hypothetical protein
VKKQLKELILGNLKWCLLKRNEGCWHNPLTMWLQLTKKLAHYCLVIWPTNNFGSHSLFLCGKPKRKQQMVFGLWLLHLVVTSYDYFLTNWLLILLNGKNILFNKINRGFEWKKLFVHGEYGIEVKSHKDPISYAKIIVQLFFIFFPFCFCFVSRFAFLFTCECTFGFLQL